MKTVDIFDSTLRDGAQGEGIQFSLVDKLDVVLALDGLGVPYIEAGNPGSNEKELAFFREAQKLSLRHAKLVAFGATRRRGTTPGADPNCVSLLAAGTPCVAVFGKSWGLHVAEVLHAEPEENLRMIGETVRFFKDAGKEVIFDAEHFFDGFKADAPYALATLKAAALGGADCLALCDTNGGSFPDEVFDIVTRVAGEFPGLRIGIHCHRDGGNAEANSLLAVKAGASQVQGTLIGFGERCGNASLSTIIPNLQLKLGYGCIPPENLARLTETARRIAEIANLNPDPQAPFIGHSAFAHKAGMHIDGVSKVSGSFEHVSPESVGNSRRFLMSEVAGRGALLPMLKRVAPALTKDSPETGELVDVLKKLEFEGYQFELAEASFELVVRRHLGQTVHFFDLSQYRILNDHDNTSTAIVKLSVDGRKEVTAAEGDGPVNAMDNALRLALENFYPGLRKVRLIDYKVRVLDTKAATAAKVRVLIQSTDGNDIWTTVGVSENIIQASWKALTDSIEYALLQEGGA
ncbi:MAG: citramalate synthase [Oscillospiraceae bacterium]|jgi:2-isopropylmalate synthase|nr:citramalate synthase [Oscillospiraceae bacterium]